MPGGQRVSSIVSGGFPAFCDTRRGDDDQASIPEVCVSALKWTSSSISTRIGDLKVHLASRSSEFDAAAAGLESA